MTGRVLAAAAVAGLAGCANLPDPGVCGNRLIETDLGEACDDGGDSPLCTAECELKCVAAADQPGDYVLAGSDDLDDDGVEEDAYCPVAHACGSDLLCRRPSGRFASASDGIQAPFDAHQLEVLDTNDDGIADLLGISATTLRIRLGDPDQPLESELAQSAPPVGGEAALVDVTDDGTTERALLVPSLDGVVHYRFHDGAPVSELELAFAMPNGSELPVPALRSIQRLRGVARGAPALPVQTSVVVPEGGVVAVYEVTLLGPIRVAECDTGEPTAVINGTSVLVSPDDWNTFVVGVTSVGATPRSTLCYFVPNLLGWGVTPIPLPGGGVLAPGGNVVFADVDSDGDPCRDLVFTTVTATGSTVSYIDQAGVSLQCAPTGPPRELASDTGAGVVLAAGRPVTIRDEVVTSDGVFRVLANGPSGYQLVQRFASQRTWTSAALADVDGDSRLDVVAAASPRDDLDVVRFSPVNGAPSPYRADTLRPAHQVVTGDFDGDFVTDVAVIEEAETGEGVSVLFGAVGGVLGAPIAMGDFEGRLGVVRLPARLGLALDADAADDLAVVIAPELAATDPYPGVLPAGFLYGGPTRRLVSPQWARTDPMPDPTENPPGELRGVAALPGPAPQPIALFASGKHVSAGVSCGSDVGDTGRVGATFWLWSWQPDEEYDPDGSLYECRNVGGNARIRAGTLAGTDVMLLADSGDEATGGAVRAIGKPGTCATAERSLGVGPQAIGFGVSERPRSITLHDLADGAGDEVVMGFERSGSRPGELVVAAASAPIDASCPVPDQLVLDVGAAVTGPAGARAAFECTHGDVLRVVTDDGAAVVEASRLVAACTARDGGEEADRAALFLVDPRRATSPTELPPDAMVELARTVGEAERVIVADMNGDGLEDIVLQVRLGALLQIELFTQCPAHDTSACDADGAIGVGLR